MNARRAMSLRAPGPAPRTAARSPAPARPTHPVLALQRRAGNRAVSALLRGVQRAAKGLVQRYEAGEHAQMGETQAELQQSFAAPPATYQVQKGENLEILAGKLKVTVAELKEANKEKLKRWAAFDGSGRMIEGFNAGETIQVPQKLNALVQETTKDKSVKITINGVVLDYGVVIAMGDLFTDPKELASAKPEELKELSRLITQERTTGKLVTTAEWEKATGGRYLKLAQANEAHFAPPGLVTASTAGATAPNHKAAWEQHHRAALEASQAGDKDRALATNAFADHFLTDAFSAGHLINKRDVMELFKGQLKLDSSGDEFTKDSQKFFDGVANDAFKGAIATEFSQYETVDSYKGSGWHPNINSASRFSTLLQGIHKEKPDLLANAVARGLHDQLNAAPGGIAVHNNKGDKWNLSGDAHLNPETLAVAKRAVAQSQHDVIAAYQTTAKLDLPALYKQVWDYTPRPTADGLKQVEGAVSTGTSVTSATLRRAVVDLIKDNYQLIIEQLVALKKLKKA